MVGDDKTHRHSKTPSGGTASLKGLSLRDHLNARKYYELVMSKTHYLLVREHRGEHESAAAS